LSIPFEVPAFGYHDLKTLIETELKHYPEAGSIDIFKLVYQALNGPTHLKGSFSEIKDYIVYEYHSMREFQQLRIQDIGLGRGFIRIYLDGLKPQTINEYASLLTELILCSRFDCETPTAALMEHWHIARNILRETGCNALQDNDIIEHSILENIPIHHSHIFRKTYEPHYRIIHSSLLDQWLRNNPTTN